MNQLNLDLIDAFGGLVFDEPIAKHGEHDQKTHGNWATGGTVYTSIIDRLSQKDVTGFSLDISSRNAPQSGYMTSDAGAEESVPYDDFFSSRDRSRAILLEYIEKNAQALSDRGAYFGIWVVKDQGTVYLDVSRRYDTRGDAVRAGFANEQQSVYDIENDEYIYMKDEEDDRTNKAVDGGSTNPRQSNDSRGEESLRGGDSQRNREESPHICLGRHQGVEKHLEGQHDQATHGSWASGRFGEDSVKSARDGAKEYAFKAGIKQDDSIDYQKTVANRARAARIADAYDELPTVDEDAFESYTALATEVEAQFEYMTKTLGIKVEFVADDPYKTSREMFADVSKGVLKVLSTASTGSHPFLSDEQNDKFRAVHDFFGHAATGRGFGQDGEESAWVHHSQMFTETARGALTTETRGQNSWYNSRGKVFAEQKVALLPKEFWEVPKTFEKSYKVIKFQAGLIPIFKHQEHDQSTHGNWATAGFTDEEKARIAEWENRGFALEDLDALFAPVSDDELREMLLNDENSYPLVEQAIANYVQAEIDDFSSRVERSPTPAEIEGITERVTEERIKAYIEIERDDYSEKIRESRGASIDALKPFFEEVFNMEHTYTDKEGVERTLESRITSAGKMADDYEVYVEGWVYDESDTAVGKFERLFFKDETTGVWAVEHKWLQLDDDHKGTGFGKAFIQQTEDFFTHRGFGYIKVLAGLEDGARHWANAGYDFNPDHIEQSAQNMKTRFESVLRGAPEGFFAQADIDEFNSVYDRLVDKSTGKVRDMKEPDFPFPAEFTMIGYDRRKDWQGNPTWLGKAGLYGYAVEYVKPLTAEGRSLLSGPIDRDGDGLVYDGTGREKPAPAPANN
jgi:GNAT superfamily N-acetyltransferase